MTFRTAATASLGTVIVSSDAPAITTAIVSLESTGPTVPPKPVRVSRTRTGSIGTNTAPGGTLAKPDAGLNSPAPTTATMPDAISRQDAAAAVKRAICVFIFSYILKISRAGNNFANPRVKP